MLRSKIVSVIVAAVLTFSSVTVSVGGVAPPPPPPGSSTVAPVAVWLIFGCASGIIFAAAIANARDNRQLTAAEAATCGLLFLLSPPGSR
jgi:hypothetical protein